MARIVLTDAKIRALRPPIDATRRDLLDAHVPGLLVRVTARGHKTFCLRTRWPGKTGADRRELGEVGTITLEQARAKALRWLKLLDQGIDPVAHEEGRCGLIAAHDRYCYFVDLEIVRCETL